MFTEDVFEVRRVKIWKLKNLKAPHTGELCKILISHWRQAVCTQTQRRPALEANANTNTEVGKTEDRSNIYCSHKKHTFMTQFGSSQSWHYIYKSTFWHEPGHIFHECTLAWRQANQAHAPLSPTRYCAPASYVLPQECRLWSPSPCSAEGARTFCWRSWAFLVS